MVGGTIASLTVVSHPEKVLFPADGVTKGEVVAYYEAVATRLLPFLVNRPLTLQRFPQGIAKPGFMQKNAGKGFPSFIGRLELPKQGGTVDFPMIHSLEGLLYLANQNTITFHIPAFRADDLEHPDRLVLDLDPSEGDNALVRVAAQKAGDLLGSLSVPTWVMTSGSKGFHLVTPLLPTVSFDELGRFAQAVAHLLADAYEDQLTVEFLKKERKGRVFVDWMRSHFGSTAVAPYSVRPRAGAPIATPISWDDLQATAPDQFELRSFKLGDDPWAEAAPFDLAPALGHVDRLVSDRGIALPEFDRFGRER